MERSTVNAHDMCEEIIEKRSLNGYDIDGGSGDVRVPVPMSKSLSSEEFRPYMIAL